MATPTFSAKLPDITMRQLQELAAQFGVSKSQIVIQAVRQLHQQEIRTMNRKYDYTVIEDNGGGLHLFLFKPNTDELVMGFNGFEYSKGSLIASLDSLDNGDDARRWEGKMDDAQEQLDYIRTTALGYEVICYREDGERIIKPEKMGRAGQIEFGITIE